MAFGDLRQFSEVMAERLWDAERDRVRRQSILGEGFWKQNTLGEFLQAKHTGRGFCEVKFIHQRLKSLDPILGMLSLHCLQYISILLEQVEKDMHTISFTKDKMLTSNTQNGQYHLSHECCQFAKTHTLQQWLTQSQTESQGTESDRDQSKQLPWIDRTLWFGGSLSSKNTVP